MLKTWKQLTKCYNLIMWQCDNVNVKNSVLAYIEYKQLIWYGHVRRINEERLPRKILEEEEEEEEKEKEEEDVEKEEERADLEIRVCRNVIEGNY